MTTRIVVDENIEAFLVDWLRLQGVEAIYIREAYPGISNGEVRRIAIALDLSVLTKDLGFAEAVFRNREPLRGLLLLRPGASVGEDLQALFSAAWVGIASDIDGNCIVVSARGIRKTPIPSFD